MALTIENATMGFDANNVQTALNNLNTYVIQDSINAMNSAMNDLREATDNAWVGLSAEKFKKNLETDKQSIIEGLNSSYEALKSEMQQIMASMGEAEEQLIKERGAE